MPEVAWIEPTTAWNRFSSKSGGSQTTTAFVLQKCEVFRSPLYQVNLNWWFGFVVWVEPLLLVEGFQGDPPGRPNQSKPPTGKPMSGQRKVVVFRVGQIFSGAIAHVRRWFNHSRIKYLQGPTEMGYVAL